MITTTISEAEAESRGLGRLTTPYKLPKEQGMMDAVIGDMKRGNIRHALVDTGSGVEVWRSGIKTSNTHAE